MTEPDEKHPKTVKAATAVFIIVSIQTLTALAAVIIAAGGVIAYFRYNPPNPQTFLFVASLAVTVAVVCYAVGNVLASVMGITPELRYFRREAYAKLFGLKKKP